MELTQLKQFKIIAEYNNLTRASQKLFITQSALSKAMYKLEEELGINLFDRTKNSISLNNAGKEFLTYINSVLIELGKIEDFINKYKKNISILRFCSPDLNSLRLIIPLFNKLHPEIQFICSQLEEKLIDRNLLDCITDAAITFKKIKHPNICCLPILKERLMVTVPCNHPFYQRKSVCLKDLNDEKFLFYQGSGYLTNYLNDLLKKECISINCYYQDDLIIYNEIRKTTKYLSFTSTLEQHHVDIGPNKKNIYLSDKAASVTYFVVYNKNNHVHLKPLLDWIHNNYKEIALSSSNVHI